MGLIRKTGVELGKIIIKIISSQIVKFTSSEEFRKRVSDMFAETIRLVVRAVNEENIKAQTDKKNQPT